MITIFTPTYNRGNLLHRLYESLCRQTCKEFEWRIVDDGSTDNTESVISQIKRENEDLKNTFPIYYTWQDNGGKHRAINSSVKEAEGELFFIADSDDLLPPGAIEDVYNQWKPIKANNNFAGVAGIDGLIGGGVIGSGLPKDVLDSNSIEARFKYKITGDMKEVFRTSVLKEFPFPEFTGETFCPEALVWNRIALKYKLRYFNKVIYLVEYQPDGISSQITAMRHKSSKASCLTYKEMMRLPIPIRYRIKAFLNYIRFKL